MSSLLNRLIILRFTYFLMLDFLPSCGVLTNQSEKKSQNVTRDLLNNYFERSIYRENKKVNHGRELLITKSYSLTKGVLYSEALGTGGRSPEKLMKEGHPHFNIRRWNELYINVEDPRNQTWVNSHQIKDNTNEEIYHSHINKFIE